MCGQCYATGAAVGEAAMLIGAPIAYAAYRRARRALGLSDTAVAPRAPESRPERAHRPTLPTPSSGTAAARPATG
jgi:hypothetical protein